MAFLPPTTPPITTRRKSHATCTRPKQWHARWNRNPSADSNQADDDQKLKFRPHHTIRDDALDNTPDSDYMPVELVDGYMDNARVAPKLDLDADEYMLMWKLRKMLHEDDFKRIFDGKRVGEF